jgi:hypothetical protein
MTLGIVPGHPDSAARAIADLKDELAKEKAAQETAQIKVNILTWAIRFLKISADNFAA